MRCCSASSRLRAGVWTLPRLRMGSICEHQILHMNKYLIPWLWWLIVRLSPFWKHSSNGWREPTTEEKSQGWPVFRWALKCVAHLIPEQWQAEKLTEIIPVYAISVDTGIREEAIQVLFRTVRDLP